MHDFATPCDLRLNRAHLIFHLLAYESRPAGLVNLDEVELRELK